MFDGQLIVTQTSGTVEIGTTHFGLSKGNPIGFNRRAMLLQSSYSGVNLYPTKFGQGFGTTYWQTVPTALAIQMAGGLVQIQ